MKYYLVHFSILFSSIVFSQENVSYAQIYIRSENTKNVTRVFFDKNGDVYPSNDIDENLFRNANYELKTLRISTSNNVHISDQIWLDMQDSLSTEITLKLNKEVSKENKLYILVHGFRKPAEPINGDTSAHDDYAFIRNSINKATRRENYFLEVYWDGMYLKPERSLKFVTRLGKMFKKQSIVNAEKAGLGLRNIVSKIEKKDIIVISHSLGAEVLASLLFNENVHGRYTTPDQRLEICMVAPAISKKEFKSYYNRSAEKSFLVADNYSLAIMYNEEDIVLSKAYEVLGVRISFSRRYGNTRLGCNCGNEAEELKKYFKKHFVHSEISLIHANSFGSSHHSLSYFGSEEFEEYITR